MRKSYSSLVFLHVQTTCFAMNISTDQTCLLALKAQIISDPCHILSTNWSYSTSVCNWIGITCGSRHQRVIELNISDMGFTGTIPVEIGHLHNLKQLGIEKNELTGSIPLTIFNISSLQVLSIWDNKLEGHLPREVGNLTMVNVLDLGINNLTGVIPDEIGNLQELLKLKLDFNNFSGSIPIGVFNISTLASISLTQNYISGNLPSTIGNGSPNLERIFLDANNIDGVLPSSISNLSKLTILELSAIELTGSIPDSLGNLRLVEILSLQGNSLTSDSSMLSFVTPLANCKHLRELILSLNPLNAILPKSTGNLSSLQTFEAVGCNLKGHVPNEI
ncbi:hypothetical protein RND71_020165 [Anisodus tanguticus]|uniref:Leucine-rich repeat-containing N-terminal plant-type domain-containing protein n=1 Tax=Anisodus tanguticus TaxID=243964 RepID=A0AAE1S0E4_9SOLA|nr:hypothetical protein RND71_020165 [Anisodus tanguticus]